MAILTPKKRLAQIGLNLVHVFYNGTWPFGTKKINKITNNIPPKKPCNKSLCLDTGDKEVLHSTIVWTCRQWLHWHLCWNWWCRQRRMGGGQNGSWGRSWLLRKIKTFQDSGKSNSLTFSCKTDTYLLELSTAWSFTHRLPAHRYRYSSGDSIFTK